MASLAPDLPRSLILVAGSTAVGKSETAIHLARLVHGEIISVDSMQIYRGLDIGTAKPNPIQRQSVRHHLLDVASLTESFDVARFATLATVAAQDIAARGLVPIACGGTGLYFKGWLEGVGTAPPAQAELRESLEAMPLAELLLELERLDPVTWSRIDRKNKRRVVRALEVIRATGQPYGIQRAAWSSKQNPNPRTGRFFVLNRTPADLQARIEARVQCMFQRGLVEETRQLLAAGLGENRTALQAIGYRQVVEHLRGDRDLPDTIALVNQRTRQYAKRQATWFRNQVQATWLDVVSDEPAQKTAARIAASL